MAKMSQAVRNSLPDSAFLGPDRSYPAKTIEGGEKVKVRDSKTGRMIEKIKGGKVVDSPRHAANAKGRSTQMADQGIISRKMDKKIDRGADKILDKKSSSSKSRDKKMNNAISDYIGRH